MCIWTSHLITTDRESALPRFNFRREDQLFSEFTQAHRVHSLLNPKSRPATWLQKRLTPGWMPTFEVLLPLGHSLCKIMYLKPSSEESYVLRQNSSTPTETNQDLIPMSWVCFQWSSSSRRLQNLCKLPKSLGRQAWSQSIKTFLK